VVSDGTEGTTPPFFGGGDLRMSDANANDQDAETSVEWGWRDSLKQDLEWFLDQGIGNFITIPMLIFIIWLCVCAALQTILLIPVALSMKLTVENLIGVPSFAVMLWFWPIFAFGLISMIPKVVGQEKDFWMKLLKLLLAIGFLVVCFRFQQGSCMYVSNLVGPERWNQLAATVTFVEYQEQIHYENIDYGDSDY
jgi:hypothetical protein